MQLKPNVSEDKDEIVYRQKYINYLNYKMLTPSRKYKEYRWSAEYREHMCSKRHTKVWLNVIIISIMIDYMC